MTAQPVLFASSILAAAVFAVPTAPAAVVSYTGSTTTFIAPTTGFYDITAVGAAGGTLNPTFLRFNAGASVEDTYKLMAGDVLTIAVGGRGDGTIVSTGGGGGTFVVSSSGKPLVVAGGGGGVQSSDITTPTAAAQGPANPGTGSGGSGGSASSEGGGGGGGGFIGSGGDGATQLTIFPGSLGGASYPAGLAGGSGVTGSAPASNGGFGGGGGGAGEGGAGGGGGYTGGNGGSGASFGTSGFGGTSFDSGSTPVTILGSNFGDGAVTITPATLTTFFASGNFESGAAFGGTLTIDTATGAITGENITVGPPDGFTFDTLVSQTANGNSYKVTLDEGGNAADILQLNFQFQTSLAGFTGNTDVTGVAGVGSTFDILDQGSILPAAVPEPTSLGLLTIGAVGFLSRRQRRADAK